MASSLASSAPDPAIIAARLAVLVPDPTPQIQSLWDGLQNALAQYDLAAISSLNGGDVSRSLNFDAARIQVAEWHAAYQQACATAAAALPADADPILLQSPLGIFTTRSRIPLEF
jgi:hypothetical protein